MSARHCIECGTPLRRISLAGAHREQCPACGHVAWRNPTPVGMALIQHQGQLVMIRRSAAPLANYWAPPAGYVECGESVPEAVIREAREECGLDIELDGLVGVYSRADVDVLIVAYRARSCGGRLAPGDDAGEVRLFAPAQLPRQTLPAGGTATDRWLFTVIRDVGASWRPD
jgi:ADP-ribose pyrophosphatase YjhB (NUDIX family)